MTDSEVICTWMDPKPPIGWLAAEFSLQRSRWWLASSDWDEWAPMPLTLDALWEVEERLTKDQWQSYCATFAVENIGRDIADEQTYENQVIWDRIHLHASPFVKIRALAAVLRPLVEGAAK